MLTVKLNNAREVLAKDTKHGVQAVSYANLSQATKTAARLALGGISASVIGRRPFYVAIESEVSA